MRSIIAIGLFAVLLLSTLLGLDISLAPGLSIKNAFLYIAIMTLVIQSVISERTPAANPGGQAGLPVIHVLFVLLIAYAIVSVITVLLAGGFFLPTLPGGGSARTVVISVKGQLVDLYLALLVFMYAPQSLDAAKRALYVILGLVAFSNLLTVVDVFNIPDLGLIEQKQGGRVQGPLGEHSQYGVYIAAFLPGIVAAALVSSGFKRVLFAAGSLTSLMALFMTASRGAILGLIVGGLLTMIMLRKEISLLKALRFAVVSMLVAVFAIAIIATQFGELLEERFIEQSESADLDSLSSQRSSIWSEAIGKLQDHPWSMVSGYGWGAFDANNFYASHNTYLEYFYDLGVIGLLLYVGVWVSLLRLCRRSLASIADREVRFTLIAAVTGLTAVLVAIFFVNLIQGAAYIWSYAGLIAAVCRLAVGQASTAPKVAGTGPSSMRAPQVSWVPNVPIPHKATRR